MLKLHIQEATAPAARLVHFSQGGTISTQLTSWKFILTYCTQHLVSVDVFPWPSGRLTLEIYNSSNTVVAAIPYTTTVAVV
jgi:hypothetical protein